MLCHTSTRSIDIDVFFFFDFFQQRLLVEKINQQLSEQIQLNLVQPSTTPTTTTTSNSGTANADVIKQIQVRKKAKLDQHVFLSSRSFAFRIKLPINNYFFNKFLPNNNNNNSSSSSKFRVYSALLIQIIQHQVPQQLFNI